MSTTLVTNMYKPRGDTYYSSTKNESIRIADMNYMHLSNAIRSIEDQARDTKRELRTANPEAADQLDGLALPTLAATLCPQYVDLVDEYSRRNKEKTMTETTKEQTQASTNEITERINAIKTTATNARSSLETVRQMAPSSVISDLDEVAKLVDQIENFFSQTTTAATPTVAPVTEPVAEKSTSAEVVESKRTLYTPIAQFAFGKNHQVNIGVRRKIAKYFTNVQSISDFSKYTLLDLLTVFTGDQVYNIAVAMLEQPTYLQNLLANTSHTVYLQETDMYPRRLEHFIRKPRFDRAGFEKNTGIIKLVNEIPLGDADGWINEADRLHENLARRARDRYQTLSNYCASYFDKAEEQGMSAEAWIKTLLEDCSDLTVSEVFKWFYKGTI